MWEYREIEPGIYTIGCYSYDGIWLPVNSYNYKEEAAKKISFLNENDIKQKELKMEKIEYHQTLTLSETLEIRNILNNIASHSQEDEEGHMITDEDLLITIKADVLTELLCKFQ